MFKDYLLVGLVCSLVVTCIMLARVGEAYMGTAEYKEIAENA